MELDGGFCRPALISTAQPGRELAAELLAARAHLRQRDERRLGTEAFNLGQSEVQARGDSVMDLVVAHAFVS